MSCQACLSPVEDMGGKFTRCEMCEPLFCSSCFRIDNHQCLEPTNWFDSIGLIIAYQIIGMVNDMISNDMVDNDH